MGFQYDVTYRLKFDDPKMEGFECTMREPSMDELFDVTELLFDNLAKLSGRERAMRRTEIMASHIQSWNLEDRQGNPLPTTGESITAQGRGFAVQLTAAWLREVVGLTIPPTQPSEPSSDSPDSALEGLPMELSAPEPAS